MNLQLFGGRGGGLHRKKSNRRTSKKNGWNPLKVPKLSSDALSKMKRSQLLTIAKAVYVNNNVSRGMTPSAAAQRFDLLQGGNTTAQLRNYIKKYNR